MPTGCASPQPAPSQHTSALPSPSSESVPVQTSSCPTDSRQANPSRPLILHTQQLSPAPSETETKPASSSSTLTPSLLNTPKLISVVEIIKREYLALLNSSDNGKGKTGTRGIWQYNETGLLPVPSSAPDEEGNAGLIRVLEGKTK